MKKGIIFDVDGTLWDSSCSGGPVLAGSGRKAVKWTKTHHSGYDQPEYGQKYERFWRCPVPGSSRRKTDGSNGSLYEL